MYLFTQTFVYNICLFREVFCLTWSESRHFFTRQIYADLKTRNFEEVSDKVRLARPHFARSLVEVWLDKSAVFDEACQKFARSLQGEGSKFARGTLEGKKSKFPGGKVEVTNGSRPIALSLAPERLLT